jgi:hypothetical protein
MRVSWCAVFVFAALVGVVVSGEIEPRAHRANPPPTPAPAPGFTPGPAAGAGGWPDVGTPPMPCEAGKVMTSCGCLDAGDTDPSACARKCPNDDMDHPTYFADSGCEDVCVYMGAHNEDGN